MAVRDILQAAAGVATGAAIGIQYVGGYATSVAAGTANRVITFDGNLTGGLASSASAGDLVVVYFGVGSTADVDLVIAGYTEIADLYANDALDANLAVGYKFMGLTPDTTVTLTGGTGDFPNGGAIAIQVWRGVDPYLPLDVVSTTATGIDTVLCNPPSITPITAGAIILAGGAGGHAAGVHTYSSSDLTSFISSGSANVTNDATVGLGYKTWTSGAFDPAAFTFSGSDGTGYSWAAVTLALRPDQNQPGPVLISQASGTTANGTALVINKPTGTREGDLMIASMNGDVGTSTWTGDTGWTEVVDQNNRPNLRIAYKVAGASEGASYTFTFSSTGNLNGTIATYRNGAYDAIGALNNSGTDPLVVGAVTASVDYARIFAAVARMAASLTITGPASMQQIALDNDATQPSRLVAQDAALSYAGSSGTRSFVMGGTTGFFGGVLTSIKPAASYTKYAQYMAVNTGGNSSSGSFSVTVNTPACVPGNLLLFVVSTANNSATDVTVSTPSGWTLLVGNSTTTTSVQPGMYVFYRVADGSEAASYSATTSGLGSAAAAIITLAGVDAATLSAGTTNTGSATTSITANGVTATANGIVLYLGAHANNNQGVVTFTPPSGMTEAAESSRDGPAVDMTLEIAYQEGLTAGATGNKTATASAALGTNLYRAILVTVGAL